MNGEKQKITIIANGECTYYLELNGGSRLIKIAQQD